MARPKNSTKNRELLSTSEALNRKQTLLQIAISSKSKKVRKYSNFTSEDYQLVQAYLREEITMSQLEQAKKFKPGSSYVYVIRVMKQYIV